MIFWQLEDVDFCTGYAEISFHIRKLASKNRMPVSEFSPEAHK